jgi:hypothetical protein
VNRVLACLAVAAALIVAACSGRVGASTSVIPSPAPATPTSESPKPSESPSLVTSDVAGLISPADCSAFSLTPRRCRAVARAAAREAVGGAIVAMHLSALPTPAPESLGGQSWGLIVDVRFASGRRHDVTVGCWGILQERNAVCSDRPVVEVMSATLGGYHDVPCADENGGGCATPLPPLDPAAKAAAAPLRIAARDIAIDHVGKYVVDLGVVTLPNGILSHAAARLAEAQPSDFLIADGAVVIYVHSLVAGRPAFDNYYLHGWWPGTEAASVTVEFSIDEFEPGAVLQLRDVLVD